MGLIKAIAGSVGGVLADSWKEFFYCDALGNNILAVRGQKRASKRSSNTKGGENVISDGSVIAVASGQAMMIIENGKVREYAEEPGEYTFDTSLEPSIFAGSFGASLLASIGSIGKRFTFGGEAASDQRVYYFNKKEMLDNKFGTASPIPFRVVDRNIGLDIDISVRCNGSYTYVMENPALFYANVCGNVEREYARDGIDTQMKSEFLHALQPAFARISDLGIRYSALPGHTEELADTLNSALKQKWLETRGLRLVSVSINSVTAPREDEDIIKQVQRTAVNRDPGMAAAAIAGAQADAMRAAAENKGGAMNGFIGMNMANAAGGMNANALFDMAAQNQKAAPSGGWTCSCGHGGNLGKFCAECGKPKPAGARSYKCDKCGWEPDDPSNPPKFCPECGDVFDDRDAAK
ncbi:MAG: SPFH domain-containing protein [Oscillospiraceae bacterium]|jgi:membrane protease subunit (stomatin/prohibitin family)|nr:SPFH domain-containing protein [Oscillospiraceae bacterium]